LPTSICFAPGEIEYLRRYEMVEQNDVGGLQRAHRAQRQQFRIAGTGADKDDRTGFGRVVCQQLNKVGVGRVRIGRGDGAVGEFFPEAAAAAEGQRERRDARAPRARRLGPAREAFRDQRFDLGAHRLTEYGRRAVGRNPDDERRTIDDRAEGEIAISRTVDDVDRYARLARGGGKPRCLRIIGAFGYGDRCSGAVGRCPRAPMNEDRAGWRRCRKCAHVFTGLRREQVDPGAGSREQLGLPRRGPAAAGNDGALAAQCEKCRQPRQRGHPGLANVNRRAAHAVVLDLE
jgi:hypothetical protein